MRVQCPANIPSEPPRRYPIPPTMLLHSSRCRLRFQYRSSEELIEHSRIQAEQLSKSGLRGPETERRAQRAMEAMRKPKVSKLPLVVNLWANSRPASTDLMYAFAQRQNCFVSWFCADVSRMSRLHPSHCSLCRTVLCPQVRDEPLCRAFHEMMDEAPPYSKELKISQPLNPEETIAEAMFGPFPGNTRLVLNKNMAKHLSANM